MQTKPSFLFEDTHLVVLDKPAGLLSQGEHTGDENLVDLLRAHFGRNYVGLVHRLDRNTSGIMVVAKRSKAAERLTRALQEGRLIRRYLGWVNGELPLGKELVWKHFLLKDEARNLSRPVGPGTPGAKEAILKAKVLRHGAIKSRGVSLLEFLLDTGRSHQIRAQCLAQGSPLVGDTKYHSPDDGFGRPALHSWKLMFPHPMDAAKILEFEAPLPEDMRSISSP